MPVTNHTITVSINGVDKTSYLIKDSLFVRMQLNNQSSTAEVKFKNYQPPDRASISIAINGTVVFGGYVIRRSASLLGVGTATVIWSCECKDWSEILESVKVTEEYVEQSDDNIIADLFSTYLPSAGFDASSAVATFDSDLDITFTDVSLREALNQLADRIGTTWVIRPDKVLYWFRPSSPQSSSFGISSTPNNSTTYGFLKNSLSYDIDSSTIVNRVKIIAGVKAATTKQYDTFTANGTSKSFTLNQIPDSVLYVAYNDGNGVYNVYGSFVGYAPQDSLRSEGGSYLAVIDPANKLVKVEGPNGSFPKNGTEVAIQYYYKDYVDFTYDDLNSQSLFGVFPYSIENKTFSSEQEARDLAVAIIEENGYGKATIKFDTTQYGLLPGQSVVLSIPEIGLTSGLEDNLLLLENGDQLLLEDNTNSVLELHTTSQTFLIQEVSLQPVITANNQFMVVSQITAGQYVPDIIDTISSVAGNKSGSTGKSSQTAVPVRLSNISSDLGEINLGRAAFTDGGTASFSWSDPGGASGAVIGLEDTNGTYGALYIYDSGTVKAKLGRLDNVPAIGTVNPSGWGLYTSNGYFSGIVYASQLTGGTVSGGLITGGTVTGAYVSGGTVYGSQVEGVTIIGGTIATGTPPINSSNPGVYMDSTGLYGYGSAGLTFRLASDPAIKPYFSSGTILNTVYEINTAAVLRTGTTNPRIQIDNSGIFAYDSGGVLRFTVDVATGRLTASQGTFSGTVSASTLTGNTISGGTVTGNLISGGTVSGALVTGGTVTGGTVSGSYISGGTVNGAVVTVNNGSVTLTTNGLRLIGKSSFANEDPSNIQWLSGGTVIGQATTYYGFSEASYQVRVGQLSAIDGRYSSFVYDNTGKFSQFSQKANTFNFEAESAITLMTLTTTALTAYKNVIPNDTASNLQLGDSSHAFRYLYLKDDNGNNRRVSINSSGVLTVT